MTSLYCKKSVDHRNRIGPKGIVAITGVNGKVMGFESGNYLQKKIKIPLVSQNFIRFTFHKFYWKYRSCSEKIRKSGFGGMSKILTSVSVL